MSALAEALVAAQRAAVTALGKAYVGGRIDGEAVTEHLQAVGLADVGDREQWLAALDVLREHGATAPAEHKTETDRSRATDAQLALLRRLCQERNWPVPAMAETLSRDQASSIIDALKNGSYDPESVPF